MLRESNNHRQEEVSDDNDEIGKASDKEIGEEDDPDFMASDDMPDEYTSVNDDSNKKATTIDEASKLYEKGKLFCTTFLKEQDKSNSFLVKSDEKSNNEEGNLEDGEAMELFQGRVRNRDKSQESEDCSAFSSVRGKNNRESGEQKHDGMVFDYEQFSSMDEDEEEKKVEVSAHLNSQ